MKLTLIELENIHDELIEKIMNLDEDQDPTELLNLYDQLHQQLTDKTDAIVSSIKALEGEIDYLKNRRDEYNQKIKVREHKLKAFKNWLIESMKNNGKDCLKGKESSIKITPNGGKRPVLINDLNPLLLPPELTTLTIDRDAVVNTLGNEEQLIIDGVIVAEKQPRGEHLRIR